MTIDLERLAFDIDYWNQVAPKGASHLINNVYHRWDGGIKFRTTEKALPWVQSSNSYTLVEYYANKSCTVIAKPSAPKSHPADTQPAKAGAQISAEWDGQGWPPFCWHGECTWGAKISWSECIILTGWQIAKIFFGKWEVFSIADLDKIEFRPILSHEERENAELIAEPEYDGTNLPPVGADQTVFVPFMAMSLRASANTESTWSVIAHHSGMAVVVINECGQGKLTVAILSEKDCRPVVSQAERERKDLATFLENYHLEMGSYWCPEKEADYILSSYDVAKKAKGEL
jgi:hypothetical protein